MTKVDTKKTKPFRDNQNYWILRRGEVPSVRNQEGTYVCDYPQSLLYDEEIVDAVCHLNNDQEVIDYMSSHKVENNVN